MGKLILLVSHFINGFCYFLLINEIVDYQKMGVEKVDALVVPIVLGFMLISHLVLRNGARRTFLSV